MNDLDLRLGRKRSLLKKGRVETPLDKRSRWFLRSLHCLNGSLWH